MLNEKTLELNVTHEILSICRQHDPHAFCFGTTLHQEHKEGYDSKTIARLPQSWLTSPLQYKRAKDRRDLGNSTFEYTFEINNNTHLDQHVVLYYHLAGGEKEVAFYALPAIFTDHEFYSSLPNLLARTFLVDVADIDPYVVNRTRHQLNLLPHLRLAILHSEDKMEVRALSSEDFGVMVRGGNVGIPISRLRENMRRRPQGEITTSSKRPRFLFNMLPGQHVGPE